MYIEKAYDLQKKKEENFNIIIEFISKNLTIDIMLIEDIARVRDIGLELQKEDINDLLFFKEIELLSISEVKDKNKTYTVLKFKKYGGV